MRRSVPPLMVAIKASLNEPFKPWWRRSSEASARSGRSARIASVRCECMRVALPPHILLLWRCCAATASSASIRPHSVKQKAFRGRKAAKRHKEVCRDRETSRFSTMGFLLHLILYPFFLAVLCPFCLCFVLTWGSLANTISHNP